MLEESETSIDLGDLLGFPFINGSALFTGTEELSFTGTEVSLDSRRSRGNNVIAAFRSQSPFREHRNGDVVVETRWNRITINFPPS